MINPTSFRQKMEHDHKQGLVNVQMIHITQLYIGDIDIISNTYLKAMSKIAKKGHLPSRLEIWETYGKKMRNIKVLMGKNEITW